ncbi:uncharacterized protein [Epargyreus clarus]
MNPHSLDFNRRSPISSPIHTPSKRRVLGEIRNSLFPIDRMNPNLAQYEKSPLHDRLSPFNQIKSPLHNQIERIKTPLTQSPISKSPLHSQIERLKSPLIGQSLDKSPLTSRSLKRSSKISKIFEERTKFKMSNKENSPFMSETFMKLDVEEETRDCSFGDAFQAHKMNWSMTKLDFIDAIPSKSFEMEPTTQSEDLYVPQKELTGDQDPEFQTLHDLEEAFDADFDQCNKYEIISTDSPNIISRGRSTSRKVTGNFVFGAPLSDAEQSTSFNKPNGTNRMLNFEDESFEFTSPATKRPTTTNVSVKKSLKFSETPPKTLKHEKSDSSIGSMCSPVSGKIRFPSESTTSMESGFISEMEEAFLDIEEVSNSPKMANFNELLSGQIKDNFIPEKEFLRRPPLHRSLSFNPEASKARVSLFSINESPAEKKSQKRSVEDDSIGSKRRKSNCQSPDVELKARPVLQRAFSENNASIMSALARSAVDPDLIGDFSLPFALPLTSGDHSDLKSISCDTLASLLKGDFTDSISDFQVIDCRYPYEYEGGHILGAVNLYTPTQILTLVNEPLQPKSPQSKRKILVFHCEFSLERGPKLSRFLRSSDRAKNKENYPSLHYPEVYLLHEGYRAFYQQYPELCSPTGYTAMLDPQHRHLLRRHRSVQPTTSRRNRLLL